MLSLMGDFAFLLRLEVPKIGGLRQSSESDKKHLKNLTITPHLSDSAQLLSKMEVSQYGFWIIKGLRINKLFWIITVRNLI